MPEMRSIPAVRLFAAVDRASLYILMADEVASGTVQ
jgi:hypothetical protein